MPPLKPGQEIVLDQDVFVVQPHPGAAKMAFVQEGAKGAVYQVARKNDRKQFALKVFKEQYRSADMLTLSSHLANYAHLPGLGVCNRKVIHKTGFGSNAIKKHPEFEYAVLMPWSTGRTWFDVINSRALIGLQVCFEIARRTAVIFAKLESESLAHCDVSSGNVLVEVDTLNINLIDVEDMYSPQFDRPSAVPHGTDGYHHVQARQEGQWRPEGDRFAAAILVTEMLCWHSDKVRANASLEGTFFESSEVQARNSPKFQLIVETLGSLSSLPAGISQKLAAQFEKAWLSTSLADCPDMKSWSSLLDRAPRVPLGTKLTDSDIQWPVLGWTEMRPAPVTINSPLTGFAALKIPKPASINAPRLMALADHNGKGQFTLRWFPVGGATSYEIARHQRSDFSDAPQIQPTNGTSIYIDNCSKGEHFFRIRAVQGSEFGPWSSPLKVSVWRE